MTYRSVEDLKVMRRAIEDARSDAAKYRQWARTCDLDAERYQGMLERALRVRLGPEGQTPEGRKWAHRAAEHLAFTLPETEPGLLLQVSRMRQQQPCPGCAERCGQCAEDALD